MDKRETEKIIKGVVADHYDLIDQVLVDSIDETASAREQVRITRIEPDLVERYSIAMLEGAKFPPPVLARAGSGYLTIDGNNRIAAIREIGGKSCAAFVLGKEVTDLQKETLKIVLNEHGMPHSRDERLREAARLVEMGMTQAEASKVGRVNKHSLSTYMGVQRGKRRLIEAGVPAKIREKITDTSVGRIGSLRESRVISATAEVVYEYGVPNDELSRFVSQLSALRSEQARISELEAWREELEARRASAEKEGLKATGRKTTAYSIFMRASGLLLREPAERIIDTASDKKLLREKAEQVGKRVEKILVEL